MAFVLGQLDLHQSPGPPWGLLPGRPSFINKLVAPQLPSAAARCSRCQSPFSCRSPHRPAPCCTRSWLLASTYTSPASPPTFTSTPLARSCHGRISQLFFQCAQTAPWACRPGRAPADRSGASAAKVSSVGIPRSITQIRSRLAVLVFDLLQKPPSTWSCRWCCPPSLRKPSGKPSGVTISAMTTCTQSAVCRGCSRIARLSPSREKADRSQSSCWSGRRAARRTSR